MNAFLIACVTAIVIAVIGGLVLSGVVQQPADKAFSTESVRLGA